MREPEPARPPVHLDHELRVQRLLEGVEDVVWRQAGHAGDHLQVEIAALDGCRGHARAGGFREPDEAPADHVPDPFGDAQAAQPAGLQAMPGGQQADQLAHEVRIALGLAVDGGDEVHRRVDPGHAGDEPADLALLEPGQGQVGGRRLTEQLGQGAAQRVAAVHLDVPIGADEQEACVGQLAGHEPEQQQARLIGPVEVVQDDDQATWCGRRPQAGGHRVEQAEAGHLRVQLGGRPPGPSQMGQLGQELGQLGHLRAELGGDLRRRAVGGVGAQRLAPGPVGGGAGPFTAATPGHPSLPGPGLGAELLGDAGLADAGLTGDEHQLTLAAQGAVERGAKLHLFGASTDEGHPVGVLGALGQGRRGSGQVGMDDREDVLRPRQPLQQMRPDVDQAGAFRELVGDQLGRGPRQQDLAAPAKRPQPGGPVERLPEVVPVAQLRLAGMQGRPRRERDPRRPPLPFQGPLERQGRGHRVTRPHEDRQGGVSLTLGLDQPALVGGDRSGDQHLMPGEGGAHGGPVTLPQRRRPLDVGEQEGQDALGEPGSLPAGVAHELLHVPVQIVPAREAYLDGALSRRRG